MILKIWNLCKFIVPALLLLSCDIPDEQAVLQEQQRQAEIRKQSWVDSVYTSLSPDQRIGQLFMVNAYSGGKNMNDSLITRLIKENHIGGLIFMQGTAEAQALLTNKYQAMSKIPLMIGMDAEWGLGMRLTGVDNYPRQMMLGASRDYDLVYQMGQYIAAQCKLLGVHINFAPDIDINNNPNNPVINFRSFGEDKKMVSHLGIAYMRGLQDNNVLACAKHFPGHGDVDIDSHFDLPIIHKTKAEMDTMELYPFQQLSDSGVASMMVAHLSIPALDAGKNVPTTLSHNVITGILKEEIGFKGLIITDALNMEGVTKYFADGEADVLAFQAGNDILLFSKNVPLAVKKIKEAMRQNTITEERLAHSVKKILASKYQLGLSVALVPLRTDSLTQQLNFPIKEFKYKAAKASLTVARNKTDFLSKINPQQKIAFLPLNGEKETFIEDIKSQFPNISIINSTQQIKDFDWVIIGVHDISLYPGKDKKYGLSAGTLQSLKNAASSENAIFVFFGNAYAAQFVPNAANVMVTYEDHVSTHIAVAEALAGKYVPKGVLPVFINFTK